MKKLSHVKEYEIFAQKINEFGFDPGMETGIIGKSYVFVIFIEHGGITYSSAMVRTNGDRTKIYVDRDGKLNVPLILGNANNPEAPLDRFYKLLLEITIDPKEMNEKLSYVMVKENLNNQAEAILIRQMAIFVLQSSQNKKMKNLNDPLGNDYLTINLIQKVFPSLSKENLLDSSKRIINNREIKSDNTHDRMLQRLNIPEKNPRKSL